MTAHSPALLASDIRLRDVIDSDLPIFFEHQHDPEANQMAAFPARTMDAFLAHWKKIVGDDSVTVKTILFNGQMAGNIVSWERDSKRLVGYWIGKNYWGQGVASQALAIFLGVVQTRPLYARVAKDNLASVRVLEKCGFATYADRTGAIDTTGNGIEELVFKLGTACDVEVALKSEVPPGVG